MITNYIIELIVAELCLSYIHKLNFTYKFPFLYLAKIMSYSGHQV